MVSTAIESSHHSCVQKLLQIMLSHDDIVSEVPVFKSWVHLVLIDLLVFEVGVGNNQLVFCAD